VGSPRDIRLLSDELSFSEQKRGGVIMLSGLADTELHRELPNFHYFARVREGFSFKKMALSIEFSYNDPSVRQLHGGLRVANFYGSSGSEFAVYFSGMPVIHLSTSLSGRAGVCWIVWRYFLGFGH
jgi:hypothetical protein